MYCLRLYCQGMLVLQLRLIVTYVTINTVLYPILIIIRGKIRILQRINKILQVRFN